MDADLIARLRRDYSLGGLDEADCDPDPFVQFDRWFADVVAAGLHEPNAVVLATSDASGAPSARLVLLKAVDSGQFIVYTNLDSRKGREAAATGRASLLFPWHPLERQVRIDGTASFVTDVRADEYFASRPRGAQIGAWASAQSMPVASRGDLEAQVAEAEARFEGRDVPRPPQWGGIAVAPSTLEFWQGRRSRLHDRIRYRKADGAWQIDRLSP